MEPEAFRTLAAAEAEHWWHVGRRAILARLLERLRLPPGARILEAGSGTGGNLALLARYGEVSAFEPDAMARRLCEERRVARVLPGSLPDAVPFPEAAFDLVVALDVIEHVADDTSALATLRARLAPGGRAVFTVPAYDFMWSPHDERLKHFRRYTRKRLVGSLESAGFEVIEAGYFNTFLFPVALVVRLAKRLGLGRQVDEAEMPPAALNRLFRWVFVSEAGSLPGAGFPFGLTVFAIAAAPSAARSAAP